MKEKIILLVEDNPDDEELTLRALRKAGIANEIIVVRDGQEALDFLLADGPHAGRDRDKVPSLVLLDLKLPKLSGVEVLRRMRSHPVTCLVPVVVLTSSSQEEDMLDSYQAGANSYIRKPVDFHEFVDMVSGLGVYWLSYNQEPPRP